jgi:serine/threonine protein kinase
MATDDRSGAASVSRAAEAAATLDETGASRGVWRPATGDVLVDRYELVHALGAGAHGSVFEAHDRLAEARVAVKIVQGVTADDRLRLRREFRALVDASHPNLVTLHDLYADDAQAFFTMELVRGVDFVSWVRGRDERPNEARLRAATIQLSRGLVALHGFGLLHRDLKPANVLVRSRDGVVKLVDFGLAARRDRPRPDDEVVGTPLYMSPEQATGQGVQTASDWYSVGVMLYEALVGHAPFAELSGIPLLAAKQVRPPAPPGRVVPGVADDLDALCAALLAVPPLARPDGAGVLRGLGATVSPPSPLPPLRMAGAVPFFGRPAALRRLDEQLRRLDEQSGRAFVLVVAAAAGHGKTALVEHFVRRLGARGGYTVLQGRCFERESVPHKGLDDLVDQLRARLAASPPRAVRGAAALASVFPVLSDVLAVQGRAPADPVERRRRAVEALRDLLDDVAEGESLVVCCEDLHWFDQDSADMFARLVALPSSVPTLFVATTRDEGSGPRATVGGELVRALEAGGAECLRLEALDAETLTKIVAAALPDRSDASALAATIAAQAGGSPLLAVELAREAGAADGAAAPPDVDLDAVVARRVGSLEAEARRLLLTIAIAGRPVAQAVALAAAGVDEQAAELLAELRARGFVGTEGTARADAVYVVHERVAASITRALDPAAARHTHARLAAALQRAGADPQQAAYHHEQAGARRRAAGAYAAAAERAVENSAFNGAARLYARAIALGGDAPTVHRWRRARADALADAGLGAESGRAYMDALAHADAADRPALRQRAAEQLLRAGRYRAGIEQLSAVLRGLRLPTPGSTSAAWAGLGLSRLAVRRRGMQFVPTTEASADPRALARVDACWAAATGLLQANVAVGHYYQTRHLLLALDVGEPRRVARALAMESLYTATAGDAHARVAREQLRRAREMAEQLDDPHSAALAAIAEAGAAIYRGRFTRALAPLQEADRRLRTHGRDVAWELSMVSTFRVMAHWYRGDLTAMVAGLEAALADAEAREDVHTAIMLRVAYGPLARLVVGDLPGARRDLADCRRDLPDHLRHSTYRYVELLTRTRLCRYAGDGAGALAAFQRASGRWEMTLLLQRAPMATFFEHDRGTAAVAAAAELGAGVSRRRAVSLAERSVAALAGQGTAWAMAMARPIRAGLAAMRGHAAQAERELVVAAEDFAALDMRMYELAVGYRLAELRGDPHALAGVERAMTAAGVAEPSRWVDLLAAPVRTGATATKSAR